MLDGWRVDKTALDRFLMDLRAGNVAVGPTIAQSTPIQVILGDFLGESGIIDANRGTPVRGVRVETFSPTFMPPGFVAAPDWRGVLNPSEIPAVQQASDWARTLTAAETTALDTRGVETSKMQWWPAAFAATTADRRLAASARLPENGIVIQFQPFDFLRWVNGVTWASEWPKYRVALPAGAPVPQPRTRRV